MIHRIKVAIGLCLTCLFLCFAAQASNLSVTMPKKVRGCQGNTLTFILPSDGLLTVALKDEYNTYCNLIEDLPVAAGAFPYIWDGLGLHGEILPAGTYCLEMTLTTSSGQLLAAKQSFSLSRAKNTVIYALATDCICYSEGNQWLTEYRLLRPGTLIIEYYRADDPSVPIGQSKHEIKTYKPLQYHWNGKVNSVLQPEGDYLLRFYEVGTPASYKEVAVTLRHGEAPVLPIVPTGAIMPSAEDTSETIWTLMQAPAVVIDLKPTSHQQVYDKPDKKSKSLGTLHGQSQCVEVFSLEGDWAYIRAWNHETNALVQGYVPLNRLKVMEPNHRYGLLIDKAQQTLTVYEFGQPIGTLAISTGLPTAAKPERETTSGSFLIESHMEPFSMYGARYQYVMRYDGGNLLHAVGYDNTKANKWDYSRQLPLLGTKASHACVRLAPLAEDDGLTAFWLYTHIPPRTRVIVLDN